MFVFLYLFKDIFVCLSCPLFIFYLLRVSCFPLSLQSPIFNPLFIMFPFSLFLYVQYFSVSLSAIYFNGIISSLLSLSSRYNISVKITAHHAASHASLYILFNSYLIFLFSHFSQFLSPLVPVLLFLNTTLLSSPVHPEPSTDFFSLREVFLPRRGGVLPCSTEPLL